MIDNDLRFWRLLSELNNYLLIISIESPQYEKRISEIKRTLSKYIEEGLESSKKLTKFENENYQVRNN